VVPQLGIFSESDSWCIHSKVYLVSQMGLPQSGIYSESHGVTTSGIYSESHGVTTVRYI
jgi:thiamine biosynthesis lipoprotein ApbE